MKKKYMSPEINVVKMDGKLMNNIAIGSGSADSGSENYSKHGVVTFDDDEEDVTSVW